MGKHYRGQRLVRITARTVHIGAAAVVLGAAVWGHDALEWGGVLMASGLVIVADDVVKHGRSYLRYAQSWAVLAKLVLLAIGLAWPVILVPCLVGALVVGSLISHAPGAIRHFPVWGAARSLRGSRCSGFAEHPAYAGVRADFSSATMIMEAAGALGWRGGEPLGSWRQHVHSSHRHGHRPRSLGGRLRGPCPRR